MYNYTYTLIDKCNICIPAFKVDVWFKYIKMICYIHGLLLNQTCMYHNKWAQLSSKTYQVSFLLSNF